MRDAHEKAETQKILQRAARERDADVKKRDQALAEQEAELTRHK